MPDFTHLHVHTQYSILDGAANIDRLLDKTAEAGMTSLAITDHGNMFGVLKFFNAARKKGIKPILGCEIYVAEGSRFEKKGKQDRSGHHLILLAKNKKGYHNLARLSSLGFLEGFYYTPRIDKEILQKYSEGLICSTACLGGEIPGIILNKGIEEAHEALQWYKEVFGDDFYLELQNHGLAEQAEVNRAMIKLAERNNIRLIATNDVHFIEKADFEAHRILICLNTNQDIDDTEGMHYSGQEYLKTPGEMAALFPETPEAITNTQEIVDKVEDYDINQDVILPRFPLPEGFYDENEYLRHLTYKGAERLYPGMDEETRKRIDFELEVIGNMGFPGYFLIVQDFINKAREMGVIVGPGRGSAAGSAVAYCTGITSVDPIRYNLLFERFLNPDRVSMPDIDVDFDDEGRDKVLKYVVGKYGSSRVAQIITFGTMAAKLAIRDVGRVLKLSLPETDRLAKLVPEKPGITLKGAYKEVGELAEVLEKGTELEKKTLTFAGILEGSARHTGTHACGVIIGPDDLIDHIPLSTAKDSTLPVTQYEGKLVESVGMLKMDFLGLKTLSIMKDAVENIYKRHKKKIDIENLPLDDQKTFELYQRGDTVGTFQFESEGMRTYLRDLKPTHIEDLIAMNALYRPGPMDFIPTYIQRKHGREKVEYPHPLLEEILKPTFGIMVYQEQIMHAAQILGGFSLGKADLLRRAMGKKNMDIMTQQKNLFIEGAAEKNIDKKRAEEIFNIMMEFAKYGFNRSHSAAYSIIAYQTAYLKAHYPAEYMAAVLTHNLRDIKKITFFIDECRRQNIQVLGPDINESELNFTVNPRGEIRFGLAAVKNVGESAVENIVKERNENGSYKSIFDFTGRVNLRNVNKRSLEALAMSGAFDSFENAHRAVYFHRENTDDSIFLEKVIKHASSVQSRRNSAQVNLFGDLDNLEIRDPDLPGCPPWTKLEQLRNEKEVTGFYMSGHPLEDFKLEMDSFSNVNLTDIKQNIKQYLNRNIAFAGLVTQVNHRSTKSGSPFASFTIEDFNDFLPLILFNEDYLKFKHFLVEGTAIFIKARVQRKSKGPAESLEVKISQVYLLSELLNKLAGKITLKVQLRDITRELSGKLKLITEKQKGNASLIIQVIDSDNNVSLEMTSRRKVDPESFIRTISGMKEVQFRVE
ncbi:MAG: DNA polymerase III subunit alpha [Bacteroidales bacterium]|nr:DNA polymerase III subunit alpha [Bacteroidales bacterium]